MKNSTYRYYQPRKGTHESSNTLRKGSSPTTWDGATVYRTNSQGARLKGVWVGGETGDVEYEPED